jgi:hypothetical protein
MRTKRPPWHYRKNGGASTTKTPTRILPFAANFLARDTSVRVALSNFVCEGLLGSQVKRLALMKSRWAIPLIADNPFIREEVRSRAAGGIDQAREDYVGSGGHGFLKR